MGKTTHLYGSEIPVKYSISASPSWRSEIISPGLCWQTSRQSRFASFIFWRTACHLRWISSRDHALGSDSGAIAASRGAVAEPLCAAWAQLEAAGVKREAAMPAEAPWNSCLRENAPFLPLREDVSTLHLRNKPFGPCTPSIATNRPRQAAARSARESSPPAGPAAGHCFRQYGVECLREGLP